MLTLSTTRPRVILVEDYGSLVGLVTVKDVLQLTPNEELHSPGLSWRSASGGLEGALEEVLMWIHQVWDSLVERYHRVLSRR